MRFLAASWFVCGLCFFVLRSLLSALVFREIEYTLAAMVLLFLVPPIQALTLTWAAGELAPRRWLAVWRVIFAQRSVVVMWALEAAVLVVFLAIASGKIATAVASAAFVQMGAGVALLGSAIFWLLSQRRRSSWQTGVLAVGCSIVGVVCLATAIGWQWPKPWGSEPVKAGIVILGSLLVGPLLLSVARRLQPVVRGPLELAAVLAAAAFSATPLLYYLRPYLGVHWDATDLVLLSLGAVCVMTAAILAMAPGPSDEATTARTTLRVNVRTALAVWMVLVIGYVAGAGFGSFVFATGWGTDLRSLIEVLLVPLGQALAVLVWLSLRARPRRRSPADRGGLDDVAL